MGEASTLLVIISLFNRSGQQAERAHDFSCGVYAAIKVNSTDDSFDGRRHRSWGDVVWLRGAADNVALQVVETSYRVQVGVATFVGFKIIHLFCKYI